jgi:flagellar biogenesis protein FliO
LATWIKRRKKNMKNIVTKKTICSAVLLFISSLGLAASPSGSPSKKTAMKSIEESAAKAITPEAALNTVESEADAEVSRVTLVFSQPINPTKVSLSEHGTFLQLEIQDSQAAKPGTFVETTSPYLKKIAIFQPDSSSASIRIFADDSLQIKQNLKMDIVESRIILTLNHKEFLAAQQAKIVDPNPMGSSPTAEGTNSQASLQSAIDAKEKVAALSSNAPKNEQKIGLAGNLRNASLFIAFIMVLAIAAFYMKGAIKNRKSIGSDSEIVSMKRLSTMALNAKQQLSLIEVGGEKLLLAVSNDSVTLITHIQKPDQPIKISATKSMPTEIANTAVRKALPSMESKSMDNRSFAPQDQAALPRKSVFQKNVDQDHDNAPAVRGTKINVKIDDNGAKPNSSDAIKDVTSIIRQKMKDLPKF